jgi:hypothetical protein
MSEDAQPLDLTSTDFSLSVLLKGKVYRHEPHTIDDLKENIHQEIATVPVDITT